MFLIDDVLLAPVSGVMYVFREIQAAAEGERRRSATALRTQLAELYGMLESGRIAPEQFDAQEKVLLDQLDGISVQTPQSTKEKTMGEETHAETQPPAVATAAPQPPPQVDTQAADRLMNMADHCRHDDLLRQAAEMYFEALDRPSSSRPEISTPGSPC